MKTLLKICALTICAAVIFALCAGCAGGGTAKTDIGLLKSGTLKVGVEIGYPPFEYYADDGTTPIGLDIDLANELANKLGVKVEFEDTAWDGIFAGLDVDKYDVVISAVTISASRKETMDFSTPYIENWQSIVVRKGSEPITSIEGLEGLKVGFQGKTTSDEYLTSIMDTTSLKCERFEYDKVINVYDDLRLGRLDAVLSDSTVSDGYIAKEPDMFEISWIQSSVEGEEPELFGVAMKQGNEKLQSAINAALKELEDSGRLDEIRKNWN